MAGYCTIIEIVEAEVQDNAKEEREIEQGQISTIFLQSDAILHDTVYAKDPEGFDQYIGKDEQQEIACKFFSHN